MQDASIVLYARGHYRIVHLAACGDGGGARYMVIDTAGVEHRRETSLDDASAWIDRVLAGAASLPSPRPGHRPRH